MCKAIALHAWSSVLLVPRRHRSVVVVGLVLLRVVREKEKDFCPGSHLVMLWLPNIAFDGHLLQLETGSWFYLGKKSFDGNRVNNLRFHFDPLKSSLVDPELALHAGEDRGILVGRFVSALGVRVQNVGVVSVKFLFTYKRENERLGQLLEHC